MLLKNIDIYVYKLDDSGTFDSLGEINEFTSLMWPDKFNGYSVFELNVPLTPENRSLIKKGNILWCGGENACIIEIIQSNMDENGQKTYKVRGRSLEMLRISRHPMRNVISQLNCYRQRAKLTTWDSVLIAPLSTLVDLYNRNVGCTSSKCDFSCNSH